MPEETFKLSDKDGVFYGNGVRFERILDHPVERVWDALTKPEALSAWLAPARVVAGVGGVIASLETKGGPSGGKILEWKENALLEYGWFGDSIVRWELLPEGIGRCRLIFICRLLRESLLQGASVGWHFHLDALALSLEGKRMKGAGWYGYAVAHWEDISREATARYGQRLRELGNKGPAPAPFIIERTFNAPIKRVWKALTDNEEIARWSFTVTDFKLEQGHDFSFYGETETKRYLHLCRITEIIPERKFVYSWRYEDIIGISYVSFELFPEGDKTRLRLTHEGLENLAHAGHDFVRSNFEAGWTAILDKGLAPILGG